MNPDSPDTPAQGITPIDVMRVLFKWKWFVLCFTLLGLGVGTSVWFLKKPLFVSTAKIIVLYVTQPKGVNSLGVEEKIKIPDDRGENIINSEIQILSSLNVCDTVVERLGVEKFAGKGVTNADARVIAVGVQNSIRAEAPRKSNVMLVSYSHPEPEVAKEALEQIVEAYRERHMEVHNNVGKKDQVLTKQILDLRQRLQETEAEFGKAMTNAGVFSLLDAKKSYEEQMAKLRQDLFDVDASIAEFMGGAVVTNLPTSGSPAATNSSHVVSAASLTNNIPADKVGEYKVVVSRVEALRSQKLELLSKYTPENPIMARMEGQIADLDKQKKQLEEAFPGIPILAGPATPEALPSAASLAAQAAAATEAAKYRGAVERKKVLEGHMKQLRVDVERLARLDGELTMLKRQKEQQEQSLGSLNAYLDQARLDATLGKERLANISVVQTPSIPAPDIEAKLKAAGIPTGVLLTLAFLLPLLIELVFRRNVRSASEIEGRFKIPLFLTIPDSTKLRHRKPKKSNSQNSKAADVSSSAPEAAIEPWSETHPLRNHFEALRDRTVMFFERITHKPKLLGVTSCREGSGTTSIAASLAATLSETGDGNVLLVDMNLHQGVLHPYFQGSPKALPDVIGGEECAEARIQENLFVATGSDSATKLERMLPKRFSNLVPRLKSSVYDYVIFDLPPVTQTSVTPRIAGMLDLVLVVVEADRIPRNVMAESMRLLGRSQSRVVAVFNKYHHYLPSWLHQEW